MRLFIPLLIGLSLLIRISDARADDPRAAQVAAATAGAILRLQDDIGDERCGLIRWEWSPEHCAVFLGLDVAGKPFGTQGHTFHDVRARAAPR